MRASAARGQAVCVLGMHRSGTSLTMGILNRLGVYIGAKENLMRPDMHNPEGYWENQRIMDLQETLLARLGGSWHEPPRLRPGWERSADLTDLLVAARRFLKREFGRRPLWGWKDPRTCLLLPFWQQLVPNMRYIICVRNPLDVAGSLAARDGFPLAKSLPLWIAYTANSLAHTRGKPSLLVFYEDYWRDWRQTVARLAEFIGLDPTLDFGAVQPRGFVKGCVNTHQAATPSVATSTPSSYRTPA